MKQKKPLLSAKPLTRPSIDLESEKLKEFISAADFPSNSVTSATEKKTMNYSSRPLLPWEKENIREDIVKIFNLRLPETYHAKLEYLSQNGKDSKHKILMDIILPEIDKKIKEIIGKLV